MIGISIKSQMFYKKILKGISIFHFPLIRSRHKPVTINFRNKIFRQPMRCLSMHPRGPRLVLLGKDMRYEKYIVVN
jgi:hypothetical protein